MAEEKVLSRRKLLRGAGYSLAGLTLAGTMGVFLPGCSETPAASDPGDTEIKAAGWPLEYVKLDPAAAEKRAYDAYMEDG
jgi:hypothetical protein